MAEEVSILNGASQDLVQEGNNYKTLYVLAHVIADFGSQ